MKKRNNLCLAQNVPLHGEQSVSDVKLIRMISVQY